MVVKELFVVGIEISDVSNLHVFSLAVNQRLYFLNLAII